MKKNAVDNRMKERGLVGDFKKGGVGGLVEKKLRLIGWLMKYDKTLEQQLAGRVQLRLLKIR